MSRDVVVAMGPASVAVMALLISRWDEALRLWARPSDLICVGVVIACLAASPIIAAFAVASSHPSMALFCVQCVGVTWGTMFVLASLGSDIGRRLSESLGERTVRHASAAVGITCFVAMVVYAATLLPWWYWPPILAVSLLKTEADARYRTRRRQRPRVEL